MPRFSDLPSWTFVLNPGPSSTTAPPFCPQPTREALGFPFFPSSGAGPGVAASGHFSLPPSLVWPEFTLVLPSCAGPWTSPGDKLNPGHTSFPEEHALNPTPGNKGPQEAPKTGDTSLQIITALVLEAASLRQARGRIKRRKNVKSKEYHSWRGVGGRKSGKLHASGR